VRHFLCFIFLISYSLFSGAQAVWQNVDSLYGPLPASVHVYKTSSLLDGKPNIAYYLEADLKDKGLDFTVDTTFKRRITPSGFYTKNNQPLAGGQYNFLFVCHQSEPEPGDKKRETAWV
jgi:hypothetical protein